MRIFVWFGTLLLFACAPSPSGAPDPQRSDNSGASAGGEESALFGQWEIVSIDGRTPDYHEMVLLFGDDWWHIQSQCVWRQGDYKVSGATLDFSPIKRDYEDYETELMPARVMCARGLSEAEKRAPVIMSAQRDFTLSNALLTIESPAGSLIARPLEDAVANPMGYTEFDAATTWGAWGIASIEGRDIEDADMVLTFDRITIRLGCAFYQWLRPIDDSGMFVPLVRRKPFASGCERAIAPEEQELLQAFDDIKFSARVGPDGRIMQAGGKKIRLTRP